MNLDRNFGSLITNIFIPYPFQHLFIRHTPPQISAPRRNYPPEPEGKSSEKNYDQPKYYRKQPQKPFPLQFKKPPPRIIVFLTLYARGGTIYSLYLIFPRIYAGRTSHTGVYER